MNRWFFSLSPIGGEGRGEGALSDSKFEIFNPHFSIPSHRTGEGALRFMASNSRQPLATFLFPEQCLDLSSW